MYVIPENQITMVGKTGHPGIACLQVVDGGDAL
jgi:hypothetical protein